MGSLKTVVPLRGPWVRPLGDLPSGDRESASGPQGARQQPRIPSRSLFIDFGDLAARERDRSHSLLGHFTKNKIDSKKTLCYNPAWPEGWQSGRHALVSADLLDRRNQSA